MNKYIKLKRLEFAVTYNCTSHCDHCFVTRTKKEKYPGAIDKKLAVSIAKNVASLYKLESIMAFGGEPLLYPEITCAIHETARDSGIKKREIISNGFWTNNDRRINEIAKQVARAGVNSICISVDCFHQKIIPIEIVKKSAQALIKVGIKNIKFNPCWVKSKKDDNRYNRQTRKILKKLSCLKIPTSEGNIVSPQGMALINLKEFMPEKIKYPKGKCADIPYTSALDDIDSICIEPNGDVPICASFKMGNVQKTNIKKLLEKYDPYKNKLAKCVIENGTKGLLDIAKKNKIKISPSGYYSICDMCFDLTNKIK